jgi:hypothetical protein
MIYPYGLGSDQAPRSAARTSMVIITASLCVLAAAAVTIAVVLIMHDRNGMTSTVRTPPADGGSFASPAQIVAKAGSSLPCSEAKPSDTTGAAAQIDCDNANVIIRTYIDHSGVAAQITFLGLGGADLLTGENWTVNATVPELLAAQAQLGGSLVHIPCTMTCS